MKHIWDRVKEKSNMTVCKYLLHICLSLLVKPISDAMGYVEVLYIYFKEPHFVLYSVFNLIHLSKS